MLKINFPQFEISLLREILSFLKPSEKRQVWLVGGTLRDAFVGKDKFYDLDLITAFNPIEYCQRFANATNAGFVLLDKERHIVRLVYKVTEDEQYTFDVSHFKDTSIDKDLVLRDFTINAIAAPLFGDYLKDLDNNQLNIYDPLNGIKHLKEGNIIPCSNTSLIDDPLRIMRAFRFMSIFNANLSHSLESQIKASKDLLTQVSGERIRDELFKILDTSNASKQIDSMSQLEVLDIIFPELKACRGVEQNGWHHLDVYEHSLLSLNKFEFLLSTPAPHLWWDKFIQYLSSELSPSRTYRASFKLGCLLHDIGKVSCKHFDESKNKVTFHGHEMVGGQMFSAIATRLRLSSVELTFHQLLIKNHMRPGVMIQQGITPKSLFRFYNECERDGTGISLLSLADRLAALGQLRKFDDISVFVFNIYQIIDEYFSQQSKPQIVPLITGKDLIAVGMRPSPLFKEILDSVKEAQYTGEITSKEEALEIVKRYS